MGTRALRRAALLAGTVATAALLPPAAGAVTPARVPLEVYGHSYAAGAGASAPGLAWGPRLAGLLGSPSVLNAGVAQAQVSDLVFAPPGSPPGAQSWWWAYRNVVRPGSASGTARTAQPAVFTGLNDLVFPDVGLTVDAIRAFVARLSEDAVVEDGSPSVTYGGSWSAVARADRNSGNTVHETMSSAAGPISVTTPAGFAGGTIVLHGLVNAPGGRWAGQVLLDGAPVRSFDVFGDGSRRHRPVVLPVRTGPGVRKIQIRTTLVAGAGAQFDYWGTITAASPYVIVFRQPLLTPVGEAIHPATNAAIAALNAGIGQIPAEFDNVLAVGLPAMDANAAYFASDHLHPNNTGHGYIAARSNEALRAAPARSTPPPPGTRSAAAAVTDLKLSPTGFRAARNGPSFRAVKVGTRVSFKLTAAGTAVFTAERKTTGRRKGKSCVKATRRNRRARRCVRYVRVSGSFKSARKAGTGRLSFSGRLRGRRLSPGSYRLIATLRGAGTKPARKGFRIVR